MDHKKYHYHHVGLITTEPQPNEEYNKELKYYASGYFESRFGIELLRFEDDSPLHLLIKTVPHVAFVVDDLQEAIGDKNVIQQPSSPTEGVTVCFIEQNGAPVEFLQFNKPEEEVWLHPKKLMQTKDVTYDYHHLGICTTKPQKNEIHLPHLKIICTDHEDNPFGLQWMRYEADSKYPESVKTITHAAFQVNDLDKALEGEKVIIQPNSPSQGVRVAFIEENGIPIEFLEYK